MLPLTQYGSYFFMYILILVTIPAFILGCMGKNIKYYGMLATALMIVIIIGIDKHLVLFGLFMIWEVGLVYIYLAIRKKSDSIIRYRICLYLSMLPIVLYLFTQTISLKFHVGEHFRVLGHSLGHHGYIHVGVLMFMGLSYLNFRIMQVIIETYDGVITEVKFLDLLYYITFFPALSSGPIDRSRRFNEDLNAKIEGSVYINEYVIPGFMKIVQGVGYKFLLAYVVHTYWLEKIPSNITFLHGWSYAYAYALYLFFDFAGYSFMAVGVGYFFGIKTPDNFNMPFISKDMKEFWTRWNITLSRWLGDYLYSRFVISSMRKKRFKNRFTASHIAQIMCMVVIGCWHGITWWYILYGLLQGITLVLTDIYQRKCKFYKRNKKKIWYKYVSIVVTFNIVCFYLLIFSGYFHTHSFH